MFAIIISTKELMPLSFNFILFVNRSMPKSNDIAIIKLCIGKLHASKNNCTNKNMKMFYVKICCINMPDLRDLSNVRIIKFETQYLRRFL